MGTRVEASPSVVTSVAVIDGCWDTFWIYVSDWFDRARKRARSRSDRQHQPFRSSPDNGGRQQQSGGLVTLLGCGCGSPSAEVKLFLTSRCALFDNTPQMGYPRGVKQQCECLNQVVVFVFTRLPVFRPHLFLCSSFPLSSSPARTVSFSPHLLPLLSHLPSRPSKCLIFPMMI